MTKLTQKEREMFYDILQEDLNTIQRKVSEQVSMIWEKAREQVLIKRGHSNLKERKQKLENEISVLRQKIHDIEKELDSEPLTVKQIQELGGIPNKWGQWSDATFHGINVKNQIEYDIVQMIKQFIDLEAPAKYLHDVARATMRELTMEGTFEGAKNIYEEFYKLDFRKYGVDIPPRLKEVKSQNPTLLVKDNVELIEETPEERRKRLNLR